MKKRHENEDEDEEKGEDSVDMTVSLTKEEKEMLKLESKSDLKKKYYRPDIKTISFSKRPYFEIEFDSKAIENVMAVIKMPEKKKKRYED